MSSLRWKRRMEFSLIFFGALAVVVAGLSKGGFGASASFAATPILAVAVGPVAAAAILLPILIVMDLFGLRAYWRQWNWQVIWPIFVACVPGVLLGWALFGWLSTAWLSILLGIMTLVFFAYHLLKLMADEHPKAATTSVILASWWGVIAGFASFVIHAGGPPVAAYLLPLRLAKREYQASTVVLFAFMNTIKMVPYFALGLFDSSNLIATAWLLPLAPLAMLAGIWAHDKLNDRVFYRVIYLFAITASVKLLWDGIAAL